MNPVKPPRVGLSVVMIAHREADRIAESLQSVRRFATEIIVVVQEKDDPTIEVAELAGARVLVHPWYGFAQQKNYALNQATCRWILQLDADEVLSVRLAESICAFVANNDDASDAASFRGREHFHGRKLHFGDSRGWWRARLVRHGTAHWHGGFVHEHQEHGRETVLKGLLEHHSCRSLAHQEEKSQRYADLWVAQRVAEGQRAPARFEVFVRAWFRFVIAFVLKMGFLDGYTGLLHAHHRRHYTLQKYARLRDYWVSDHYKRRIDRLIAAHQGHTPSRTHGLDRFRRRTKHSGSQA